MGGSIVRYSVIAPFIFFILNIAFFHNVAVGQEMYQRCSTGTDCIIGEYIFDDQGNPITSNSCTIDIRNPSGTLIVDDESMTENSDGWHYYTVNISSPEGLYRSIVYCNDSGDVGYLNKSFYVGSGFATQSDVTTAEQNLELSLKTLNDYDLGDIVTYVDTIETSIGTSSDSKDTATIFGRIENVQDKVNAITTIDADIDSLLAKWDSYEASDIYNKVKNLSDDIDDVNVVEDVEDILDNTQISVENTNQLKNTVYAMKALVEVNRRLLEESANKPIIKTWLEEGSIIFKILIVNPSTVVEQTVPIEYHLPKEVGTQHILKVNPGITIEYDATQGALFATGDVVLKPEESKIIEIKVEDIWVISDEEVESARKQAENLLKPLEDTSYYAQGVLLKTDIDASLDRVVRIQKEAGTPQGKIRAYRSASEELDSTYSKIDALKDLVSSAGSVKTIFGFIGGVGTFAVWGIVVVFIAGFVFLATYMKTITSAKTGESIHKNNLERFMEKISWKKFFLMLASVTIALLSLLAFMYYNRNKRMQDELLLKPVAQSYKSSAEEVDVLGTTSKIVDK